MMIATGLLRVVKRNMLINLHIVFFNVYIFLRWRAPVRRGKERGGIDYPKWALHDSSEPNTELELMNCEIMTGAKVGHSTH